MRFRTRGVSGAEGYIDLEARHREAESRVTGAEAQRRRSGGAAGVQRFVVEIVMELGRRGRRARLNARGG